MNIKEQLSNNITKIHTTNLGLKRIKKNLYLKNEDVISYCQSIINNKNSLVSKKGKNYYVKLDNIIITINSYSYTIITAHLLKKKEGILCHSTTKKNIKNITCRLKNQAL